MDLLLALVFIVGYVLIALEKSVAIDKTATALITGVLCWCVLVIGVHMVPAHMENYFAHLNVFREGVGESPLNLAEFFDHRLLDHLQEIAGILLFLLGAMTVVELVDAHEGFRVITDRIRTRNKVKLLWTLGIITFFLSSALDNLTTTIVMISLCRKLIADQKTRWLFGGLIVIAANAGGAWSPIGDVTTTMLWIGKQITTFPIMKEIFLASALNLLIPMLVLSMMLKGSVERPAGSEKNSGAIRPFERNVVFLTGIGGLLFVPIFKTITHLPPFMGMMFGLAILWIITELIHKKKIDDERSRLSAVYALRRIDTSSILFFLGILLAVSALQEAGHLLALSEWLRESMNNIYAIDLSVGLLSAIVDNVPLVAACMGMYELAPPGTSDLWMSSFMQDGPFWHFLAYTAGTGGSILIIGSASGVAAMGLEKIDFMWYLKRISLLALLGYFAGGMAYIVEMWLTH